MILNLISGPRNISTALMYSFAQRNDTTVIDEPFYAFYLLNNAVEHPGQGEVIESMESDPKKIISHISGLGDKKKKHVFIKNMAHHLAQMPLVFLTVWHNIFLIRDPYQVLASYSQVIDRPTMQDIGIQRQYEIWNWLQAKNQEPLVLDSDVLLENPEKVLQKLCDYLGIPFSPSMLMWKSGPRKEDGIWAKYWYGNVHQSTGFQKNTGKKILPNHLTSLYGEADAYYKKLKKHSLTI